MKHLVSLEDLTLMGCDAEDAECWLLSRGKNKLTTSALKLVISEADKLGWTLAKAVKFSAQHGYVGFKAAWVKVDSQKTCDADFITLHTDRNWALGLGNGKVN